MRHCQCICTPIGIPNGGAGPQSSLSGKLECRAACKETRPAREDRSGHDLSLYASRRSRCCACKILTSSCALRRPSDTVAVMLAGITASNAVCQHCHVQPLRPVTALPTSQRVSPSDGLRSNRSCIRCSAAVAAATIAAAANIVDQPADNGLSMHPDAVKRRQEAEARYLMPIISPDPLSSQHSVLRIFNLLADEKHGRLILHMQRQTSGGSLYLLCSGWPMQQCHAFMTRNA